MNHQIEAHGSIGGKRGLLSGSRGKNPKGGLPPQFTKVQTKETAGLAVVPNELRASRRHPCSQWSRGRRDLLALAMCTFTVTTNERPAVARPRAPSVPFRCGHAPHTCPASCLPPQRGSTVPGAAPACPVQSSEQQQSPPLAQSNGLLSLLP